MERKTTEAQSTENIIEIRNLVRQFEDDGTIAVDHISLNIRKGESPSTPYFSGTRSFLTSTCSRTSLSG